MIRVYRYALLDLDIIDSFEYGESVANRHDVHFFELLMSQRN